MDIETSCHAEMLVCAAAEIEIMKYHHKCDSETSKTVEFGDACLLAGRFSETPRWLDLNHGWHGAYSQCFRLQRLPQKGSGEFLYGEPKLLTICSSFRKVRPTCD